MRYTYPGLIDFELGKVEEDGIFFEVFSQDPSITAKHRADLGTNFVSSTGYYLKSYDYLDVLEDLTYIIGCESGKAKSGTFYFENRDEIYDKLLGALTEFAASKGVELLGFVREQEQLTLWD